MRKLFIIALMAMTVVACKKTDEDHPDLGLDYYPIEIGNYISYTVKESVYDEFGDSMKVNTYLYKERIDSSFLDLEGRTNYMIKSFVSEVDTIRWNPIGGWISVYKSGERLERMEGNETYVRLVFPLRRSKTWDGNAANNSASQIYKVLDYDLTNAVGGKTFTSTCRINQLSNSNLIEDQLQEEIYSRDVGLIYRIDRDFELFPGKDSVIGGSEVSWTYHGRGTE